MLRPLGTTLRQDDEFGPSSIQSTHHAFFEVAYELGGTRPGSGRVLDLRPLTVFLDGWERDVNSTVVDGAVIISRQVSATL